MARLLVILNPVAGRGKGASLAAGIERVLAARGHHVRILSTERKGHARELASGDNAHWSDGLIAAGGDGTLNEVINGRGDLPLPVGIVPLGTGNVLAKELGIGRRPEDALAPAAAWQLRAIDLLELGDGRRLSCMLSVGAEGRVIQLLEELRAGGAMRMGQYIPLGLRAMREADYRSVRVTLDGETVGEELSYAVVANTHSFGGPIELLPTARCDDGALDVLTARLNIGVSYPGMICASFFRQLYRLPGIRIRRGRSVRFESLGPKPVPYQVDGEYAGTLPVSVRVLPGALTVFAPDVAPAAGNDLPSSTLLASLRPAAASAE
jgi:diacylglycerol kinase (ATP)